MDEPRPTGQELDGRPHRRRRHRVRREPAAARCRTRTWCSSIRDNPFWVDEVADPLAPRLFVDQIEVPVFLAGAWQDEQTGGRFATMLDGFTGTDHLYVDLVNGLHTESISAGVFPRFVEFLDLYVAERVPSVGRRPRRRHRCCRRASSAPTRSSCRTIASGRDVRGGAGVRSRANRRFGCCSKRARLTARCRARRSPASSSRSTRGRSRRCWPSRGTSTARRWSPGRRRRTGGTTSYNADPDAAAGHVLRLRRRPGVGLRRGVGLACNRRPGRRHRSSRRRSRPRPSTPGRARPTCGSARRPPDTDLEVTISEIRPDGQEVYIQSGWLRASHRALDDDAQHRTATRCDPPRSRRRRPAGRRVVAGAGRDVPVRPRRAAGSQLRLDRRRTGQQPRRVGVRDHRRRRDGRDRMRTPTIPSRVVLPGGARASMPPTNSRRARCAASRAVRTTPSGLSPSDGRIRHPRRAR